MKTFKNWSGSVIQNVKKYLYPKSEEAIQSIVRKALASHQKVRVVGSGHSFTPLCATNDILISLDAYKGLVSVNPETKEITVKAGTKIYELGLIAHGLGYAQINLGDIDRQSIAGSISTGTHGTGLQLGTIATQVTQLRLVNGQGEIITCSRKYNQDLFKAAQISLGALGIITEVTLKLVDAYVLEFTSGKENIEQVLDQLDDYNTTHRNFEFYWFPHTQTVQTKYSNISKLPPKSNTWGNWLDNVLENYLFEAVSKPTRYFPQWSAAISKLSARVVSTSKKRDWSYKVYALPRSVRFNEMEYNVPYECYREVKKEILKQFDKHKFNVHFPTENRFVAADDIYLSPAYGRDSAYIAFHVYKGNPYQNYFKVMEEICLDFGGRPHWGKMHTLKANQLAERYPKWTDFTKHVLEQDPEGVFRTPYLSELLFS